MSRKLVAYFSASGTTAKVAKRLADGIDADLFEIKPKPQNIYGIGKGFERTIKLIDLGSAVRIDQLKDDANKLLYTRSTFLYESPLQRKITEATDQDDKRLLKFIQELSVKDDIYAAAIVMKYLLGVDEGVVSLPNTNHYCLELLNEIIGKATSGGKIETCGLSFQTAHYDSVVQMQDDLIKLSNALLGAGINKTILLENGEKYVRQKMSEKGAFVNGAYRIDEALIPSVRRRSEDDGSDEKTVVDLNELSGSEKKNLFIVSEGGAGKTYLLWKTYLDYAERREMIPIYIPLNEMTFLEDFLLYFIANKYTGVEGEDKASKVISYFEKHTDQHILILADGLNEIPTTKPQNKRDAVNKLLELSKLPNVSMVVTSRREDSDFSSFDQYELAPLDEIVLREKISDYDNVSDELRELLKLPFNLSLYLHMPAQFKYRMIENTTDLLDANINWLRDKLKDQGFLQDSVSFLFDLLLPTLSSHLSYENKLSFALSDIIDIAEKLADAVSTDRRDKDIAGYLEICDEILSKPLLTVNRLVNILADNVIIFISDEFGYVYSHEIYRDFFAMKSWKYMVEHYSILTKLDCDYFESLLTVPVYMHGYLRDLIDKENSVNYLQGIRDYYDGMFDKSTRGIKHDEKARRFNRAIIDTMRVLGTSSKYPFEETEEDHLHRKRSGFSAFFYHDFSDLDLSQVRFLDSCLSNCSFNGAVLSESAFRHPTVRGIPDLLWNDDTMVVMAYKEGYVRCVSLDTYTIISEFSVETFDSCFIDDSGLTVCVYHYESDEELFSIATLYTYDVRTGRCISSDALFLPLSVNGKSANLDQDKLSDILLKYCFHDIGGFDKLSNYLIKELWSNDDKIFALFQNGLFRFERSDKGYLCDDIFLFDEPGHKTCSIKKYIGFKTPDCKEKTDSSFMFDHKTICVNSDVSDRYAAVYLMNGEAADSDYFDDRFWLVDTYGKESDSGIRILGPYYFDNYSSYGALLDMRIADNTIVLLFRNDERVVVHYFDEYMNEVAFTDEVSQDFFEIINAPNTLTSQIYRFQQNGNNDNLCVCDESEFRGFDALISSSKMYTCIFSDGLLEVRRLKRRYSGEVALASKKWMSFVATRAYVGYQVEENLVSLTTEYNDMFNSMCNWKRAYDIGTHRIVAYDRFCNYYFPEEDQLHGEPHPQGVAFSHYITEVNDILYDKHIIHYEFDMDKIISRIDGSDIYWLTGISPSQISYVADQYILVPSVKKVIFVIDTYDNSVVPILYDEMNGGVITQIIRLESQTYPPKGVVDRLITVVNNVIYEFKIDLLSKRLYVLHRTEFFPDVWIEECTFENVDIINDTDKFVKLKNRDAMTGEERMMIRAWEENNIEYY